MKERKVRQGLIERFVKTWQLAKNVREVADCLGIDASTARCRAGYYRDMGVPLKEFKANPGPQYNWDRIKDLAKSSLREAKV